MYEPFTLSIEKKLKDIFQSNYIEYLKRNIQTDHLEFFIWVKAITPKINADWSKSFPNGSYFSISKTSIENNGLSIILSITQKDFDNNIKELLVNE